MNVEKVEPDLYACKVNLPYDCYVIVHGSTRQEAIEAGIEVLARYYGISEDEAIELTRREENEHITKST